MAGFASLEKLYNIESLNLNANPIVEEKGGDFKKEFLILLESVLGKIKKLNKEEVTKDDYTEAQAEKEERRKQMEEEEAARLEAARLAELEGKENPDGGEAQ